MMISKNLNKFEIKIPNVYNILITGYIYVKQATSMNTKFEDNCLCNRFPITKMKDLYVTKLCIPTTHTEPEATIETISHSINCRFLNIIPTINMNMVEMISPFKQSQNGYTSLWTIMQQTCQFIRPAPEGWGPEWTKGKSPSKYITLLQHFVMKSEMRYNCPFTMIQQSKKMIYWAAQSFNQNFAMKLYSELSIWINSNRKKPLLDEW